MRATLGGSTWFTSIFPDKASGAYVLPVKKAVRRKEGVEAGDRVRVRTDRGVIGYTVTGVTIYKKGALAKDAQRVFSQEGPGRLVLITCEDYNGTYWESNAIVFAERGT